jgi:hypothetical protein
MGLLSIFNKAEPGLLQLPSGSFSVGRDGDLLAGTVPSSFPPDLVDEIAREVLTTFKQAAQAQLPLSELVIDYPGLRIIARELRGGALIFLNPKEQSSSTLRSSQL